MKQDKKSFKIFVSFIVVSIIAGMAGSILTIYLLPHSLSSNNVIVKKIESEKNTKSNPIKTKIVYTEESATTKVVKKASPAVVNIIIKKDISNFYNATGPNLFPFDDFFNFGFPLIPQTPNNNNPPKEKKFQRVGGGSGFIISKDGIVLTNKHVVSDDDAVYTVLLQDGRKFDAKILGRDPLNDIAVLKIDTKEKLPVLELGDSDKIEIGSTVIAIGYSLGEFPNSVTRGIISGKGRKIVAGDAFGQTSVIEGALQTDAAINPGNSGGPLLNIEGKVIGINTAISRSGQLVGFAIPINSAKRVVESVLKYGKIVRPFLGIRYVMINKQIAKANNLDISYGALILRGEKRTDLAVIPGSPADKAGLKENDIILEVDGKKLDENNSLIKVLSNYKPDDKISLKILRKGEEKIIKVVLGEFKQ